MERTEMKFSEQSRLLIENWQTYEYILAAGGKLTEEIGLRLEAIRESLPAKHWWDDDMVCIRRDDDFFLSRTSWLKNGWYTIGVGVENFTPAGLFGDAKNPAALYLWVSTRPERKRDLENELRAIIGDKPAEFGPKSAGYIRKEHLRRIGSGDEEAFDAFGAKPLCDWIDKFALFFPAFDKAVQAEFARQNGVVKNG